MDTKLFKTKTIFIPRKNISPINTWCVALDIGYSSVKGMSPNHCYSFPSYAKKMSVGQAPLGTVENTNILYKDNETNELWCVGETAQAMVTADDTQDSLTSLYGRSRYFSPMFLVIARTGLALGMLNTPNGNPLGKNLVVQTGLPPAYMKSDKTDLIESLSGHHSFSIKIGDNAWTKFDFTLPKDNISVMPQPMGTLFSISTNSDCKQIPEAKQFFSSKVLIFDPGFGTLDVFKIGNNYVEDSQTFDDLGMKNVLKVTSDEIYKKYGVEIPVPAMQENLATGLFKCINKRDLSSKLLPFDDILEHACANVCDDAITRILNIYNIFDLDYFAITGGTGAAWYSRIAEKLHNIESLKIISGNKNDNLPPIFSNVRGYYLFLVSRMLKKNS